LPLQCAALNVDDTRPRRRELDSRREVKMPPDAMAAPPFEAIQNRHHAGRPVETDRSLVHNRFWQPRVPAMAAAIPHDAVVILDVEMLGRCLLEHPEQPFGANLVLLLVVDRHRIVGARAPHQIAHVGIRRVHVAARIDDDRLALSVIFEPEQIVVFVIAESVRTHDAIGDEQVVAPRAHHGHAGVWKVTNAVHERRGPHAGVRRLEPPPHRFPGGPVVGQLTPFRRTEEGIRGADEMPRILRIPRAVLAEDVEPAVVGIAHLWHQAVGPNGRREELDHRLESAEHRARQRRAIVFRKPRRTEEKLRHETVIRD
jgi:hypothetical protein